MASIPGIPSIPGVDTLTELARSQLHVMQQIPAILISLNTTLTRLADAIGQSSETMASVQRVTNRMDRMLDELEEPVTMMGPGLRRLAVVLDDPMITAVPDLLRTLQSDLGPQLHQVLELQRSVQQSAMQVTHGLADATRALTAIPGVSMVSGLLTPRGGKSAGEAEGEQAADARRPAAEAEAGDEPEVAAKAAVAATRRRTPKTNVGAVAAKATATAKAAGKAASGSAPVSKGDPATPADASDGTTD